MTRTRCYKWYIDTYKCWSTDIVILTTLTNREVARLDLSVEDLGSIAGHPLRLLVPLKPNPKNKSIIISAGFHGEEPAGCWGILKFLQQADKELFKKVNLSFLPIVNSTGIKKGTRLNMLGENPNGGYCHLEKFNKLSVEGEILMENLSKLKRLAKNGYVALHEDVDAGDFYIYTFEQTPSPTKFTRDLINAEKKFFKVAPDGVWGEEVCCKDGVYFMNHDGSLEDRLFHEGVPYAACTETPGRESIEKRILANAEIIRAAADFFISS